MKYVYEYFAAIVLFGFVFILGLAFVHDNKRKTSTNHDVLNEDQIVENIKTFGERCKDKGSTGMELSLTYDADGKATKGIVCKW